MDDETPAMEELTQQMRATMAAWVADPGNDMLKRDYLELQRQYQRLFREQKSGQRDGAASI